MGEWKEYKISDLVSVNQKSISKDFEFDEIEYLDTGSITMGKIESYQRIKITDAPSRAKRLLKANDIVYSTVRPIQRHYGLLRNPKSNTVVSTGFAVITCNEELADPNFIYYFLTQDDIVNYLDSVAEGSTSAYPSLTPDVITNLELFAPDLSEQKSIASILSSLDDKIDLLHRQNKTLEALAETLFRQWFVEEADESWERGKLGDYVTIVYGKNLPTSKLTETGYPVFGGNGQIGYYESYHYELPQVLVSCRGEASGVVNISLPKSFVTNNSLVLEMNKNKFNSFEFLKYFSLATDYKVYVTGSAQPQITIETLNQADFILPPKDLIDNFSNQVNKLELKRSKNEIQIRTLTQLRDTLLPKLMSGEVRVKT